MRTFQTVDLRTVDKSTIIMQEIIGILYFWQRGSISYAELKHEWGSPIARLDEPASGLWSIHLNHGRLSRNAAVRITGICCKNLA